MVPGMPDKRNWVDNQPDSMLATVAMLFEWQLVKYWPCTTVSLPFVMIMSCSLRSYAKPLFLQAAKWRCRHDFYALPSNMDILDFTLYRLLPSLH